ncbi:Krueppel-like factor 16 [Penaeus monodon]|uniref:Krueppel-like factor 16 n=1 Tax=Penaeus monodon TaxID=6687 RepID=UPI0018A72576|nr:Krueppel-like factor 16 [Penaeus monodon]
MNIPFYERPYHIMLEEAPVQLSTKTNPGAVCCRYTVNSQSRRGWDWGRSLKSQCLVQAQGRAAAMSAMSGKRLFRPWQDDAQSPKRVRLSPPTAPPTPPPSVSPAPLCDAIKTETTQHLLVPALTLASSLSTAPLSPPSDPLAEDAHSSAAARRPRPKKFSCSECGSTFSNKGQLKGHLRIHTGERPFACDHEGCDKRFTRNEELTRHRRIHSGARPFPCPLCDKRFGRKDHLKKHVRTHQRQPLLPPHPLLHHLQQFQLQQFQLH